MFGLTDSQTQNAIGAGLFLLVSGANYWRAQLNGKKIDNVQDSVISSDREIREELLAVQRHLKTVDALIAGRSDRRRPQDPTTIKVFANGGRGRRCTDAIPPTVPPPAQPP